MPQLVIEEALVHHRAAAEDLTTDPDRALDALERNVLHDEWIGADENNIWQYYGLLKHGNLGKQVQGLIQKEW